MYGDGFLIIDKKLRKLINLFRHNKKQYKGKHYDEVKIRANFIDKFFEIQKRGLLILRIVQ